MTDHPCNTNGAELPDWATGPDLRDDVLDLAMHLDAHCLHEPDRIYDDPRTVAAWALDWMQHQPSADAARWETAAVEAARELDAARDQIADLKSKQGALEDTVVDTDRRRDELEAAIQRVRALHKEEPDYVDADACGHPQPDGPEEGQWHEDHPEDPDWYGHNRLCLLTYHSASCSHCMDNHSHPVAWPCATIRTLDEKEDQ